MFKVKFNWEYNRNIDVDYENDIVQLPDNSSGSDIALRSVLSHYSDVIMSVMAFQITGISIVCSTVCSGADQKRHQSSMSLPLERGIHRWPVDSPHKGPVARVMFPFDDFIMRVRMCRGGVASCTWRTL